MKKYKKIISTLLAFVMLTSTLFFSACQKGTGSNESGISSVESTSQNPSIDEQNKEDWFEVSHVSTKMHTSLQLAYIKDSYENISTYAKGDAEKSKPEPVTITWQAKNKETATDTKLLLSEDESFETYQTIKVTSKKIKLYNLIARKKYYYQLTGTINGKTVTSEVKSFATDSYLPRVIDCEGVTNMRDLGGYNVSGGVVKQGLIYRSGRLNKSYVNEIQIEVTEKGMETLKELGIKTEIDLRTTVYDYNELGGYENEDVGPLGEDVNYYKCPMLYKNEQGAHTPNVPGNWEQVQNVFAYMADESNYPMIIHCNIGTDRTGFISYLLNAFLGVSKEDLYRDYLFSNFGNIQGSRSLSRISDYVNAIDACEGDTLSQKAERYLVDTIGVSQSVLDSIKEIMIEEHTYEDTVLTEATCIRVGRILHTCLDNDLLSLYEYTDYGDHTFQQVPDANIKKCTLCNKEEASYILPTGYTQLEYIESDGRQYIDTGFSPDSNTRVITKVDFRNSTSGSSQNAFSARGDAGNAEEYGFLVSEGSYVSRYGDDKYLNLMYSGKPFVVDQNKNVLSIDGEVVYTHEEKQFFCDVSMTIFASNRNGEISRYACMKLYYLEIHDNDTLVRYFIPCMRDTDGEIGLYDVINNQFYANKGTGSFITQ